MIRYFSLFLFIIINISCSKSNFDIYYSKNLYTENYNKNLENHKNLKTYSLVYQHNIVNSKKEIDSLKLITYIKKIYPQKQDRGVVCLDLENYDYLNLKKDKSEELFNKSLRKFIKVIKDVKQVRPFLKIGFYGLPFRFFYESQKKWNKDEKFKELFMEADVVFPSLYILYPSKQTSIESNLRYIKENLDITFENIPNLQHKLILPFLNYRVHVSNKKFKNELLPVKEMKIYIDFLKEYINKGKSINGFVWWEYNSSKLKSYNKKNLNKEQIFSLYLTNYFINK